MNVTTVTALKNINGLIEENRKLKEENKFLNKAFDEAIVLLQPNLDCVMCAYRGKCPIRLNYDLSIKCEDVLKTEILKEVTNDE